MTMIAATGGIGQQSLQRALAAGQKTAAVVRNSDKPPLGASIHVIDAIRTLPRRVAGGQPHATASVANHVVQECGAVDFVAGIDDFIGGESAEDR